MPAKAHTYSGKGPNLLQGDRMLPRKVQASLAQWMQALLYVTGGIGNTASNAVFGQPL